MRYLAKNANLIVQLTVPNVHQRSARRQDFRNNRLITSLQQLNNLLLSRQQRVSEWVTHIGHKQGNSANTWLVWVSRIGQVDWHSHRAPDPCCWPIYAYCFGHDSRFPLLCKWNQLSFRPQPSTLPQSVQSGDIRPIYSCEQKCLWQRQTTEIQHGQLFHGTAVTKIPRLSPLRFFHEIIW